MTKVILVHWHYFVNLNSFSLNKIHFLLFKIEFWVSHSAPSNCGDCVTRCLLVVGGSEVQPSRYLTEELRVCPTRGWAALLTLCPTPRPHVDPMPFSRLNRNSSIQITWIIVSLYRSTCLSNSLCFAIVCLFVFSIAVSAPSLHLNASYSFR